jgi:hypothetical protein
MARPGLRTSAAVYRIASTHTEYGGLLRTGLQKPGAGVADSPQQSAMRLHGALTMGAHCSRVSVREDRGVVEQQCSTAHESDGPIVDLRTEESLRGTARVAKTLTIVHNRARGYPSAHARTKGYAEQAGYSRALRGSKAYSQYYGVHKGMLSTWTLKGAYEFKGAQGYARHPRVRNGAERERYECQGYPQVLSGTTSRTRNMQHATRSIPSEFCATPTSHHVGIRTVCD